MTKFQLEVIIVVMLILAGMSIATILDPEGTWLRNKLQEEELHELRR